MKTYDGILGRKKHDELGKRRNGLVWHIGNNILASHSYRSYTLGFLALETNKQKIDQKGGEINGQENRMGS
ncbi:MAG: hypothetical protein A2860_00150 [Candidatus Levybacteria bacterium RIFCSPHIGHO2_01_FULL_37_33]|nr:MAG: hypothetical protein A2860_00150 [Candidatus Levybacteria bacterium RIFCSPHIGHO2_01_FULL_37_33]